MIINCHDSRKKANYLPKRERLSCALVSIAGHETPDHWLAWILIPLAYGITIINAFLLRYCSFWQKLIVWIKIWVSFH